MSRRGRRIAHRSIPYRRPWRAAALVLLALLILVRWWQSYSQPSAPEVLAEGTYLVARVVDGDTLLLANHARVRLIGADTPETVKPDYPVEPYGPQAADFTRRFVAEAGETVRLQFDREQVDQYGRFLAYVLDDGRMLNEELIRAGLATAQTGFRYSSTMKTRFRRAQDEAQAAGRGIWSPERPQAGNL